MNLGNPLKAVVSATPTEASKGNSLKREFGLTSIFGLAFSVVSLAPSISSLLVDAFPGSGVSLTWGWFTASVLSGFVYTSLSEFASAMPSAAGPYLWTYKLAPPKWKNFLSFFCGYNAVLGLIAGVGSCNYGAAQQLLACVELSTGYKAQSAVLYGVYAGLTLIELVLVCLPRIVATCIEVFAAVLNLVVIFIVCIALPVGMKASGKALNSGEFVFGDTTNYLNYPYGMTFLLSFGTNIWTMTGAATPIYLAEEAKNPSRDVPISVLGNLGLNSVLGFAFLSLIAACMDGSKEGMQALLGDNIPLASIIDRALGSKWATAIMCMFAFLQFSMGFGAMTANSRETYAFARDNALPFSKILQRTMTKSKMPVPALIFVATVVLLIGLLIFVGPVAANAIFSLMCACVYLAFFFPITLYILNTDGLETRGWFSLGPRWSKPVACVGSCFSLWVIIGNNMMPANIPVSDPNSMNYTCLVCGAVWIGALLHWVFSARKWFNGPEGSQEEIDSPNLIVAEELFKPYTGELESSPSIEKSKLNDAFST